MKERGREQTRERERERRLTKDQGLLLLLRRSMHEMSVANCLSGRGRGGFELLLVLPSPIDYISPLRRLLR